MTHPDFDPLLHDEVARSQGFIPAAMDGLTHLLGSREGVAGPECGAAEGTRLSANWALVNCLDCRGPEPEAFEFSVDTYRLSSRPGVVGGPS
ncbi:hypothetical protein ABZT06_08095 [Streptomyces sp. NPDC005483]|uniref:hypothetical protein n=1 Tax=Streptomyces sp. NPDC005483 TaxID=3154882 RepID=UPI0033B331B5